MHAMRGSKDLYSRILGGIGNGSEGQTQLQYFNLAMENVLKGLPDKISCPYIIHKRTGAWGMDFVSSSPLFSTTPLFQNFHVNHSFFKIFIIIRKTVDTEYTYYS